MAENPQNPENGDATSLPEIGADKTVAISAATTIVPESSDILAPVTIPASSPPDTLEKALEQVAEEFAKPVNDLIDDCEAIVGEVDVKNLPEEFQDEIASAEFDDLWEESILGNAPVPISQNVDPSQLEAPYCVSLEHHSLPAIPPPALKDLPSPEFIIAGPPSIPSAGLYSFKNTNPPSSPSVPEEGATIGPPPGYNARDLMEKAPQSVQFEQSQVSDSLPPSCDPEEITREFPAILTYLPAFMRSEYQKEYEMELARYKENIKIRAALRMGSVFDSPPPFHWSYFRRYLEEVGVEMTEENQQALKKIEASD